jgi:hypothetical protein
MCVRVREREREREREIERERERERERKREGKKILTSKFHHNFGSSRVIVKISRDIINHRTSYKG